MYDHFQRNGLKKRGHMSEIERENALRYRSIGQGEKKKDTDKIFFDNCRND